jgi:hypothetical protein
LDGVTFAVFQENYRRPWAMRAVHLRDESEAVTYRKLGYSECLLGKLHPSRQGKKQFVIDAAINVIDDNFWQDLHKATFGDRITRMAADKYNRALFHTALTAKTQSGAWQFRDRFYRLLLNNEELHFELVREGAEQLFGKFQNKAKG